MLCFKASCDKVSNDCSLYYQMYFKYKKMRQIKNCFRWNSFMDYLKPLRGLNILIINILTHIEILYISNLKENLYDRLTFQKFEQNINHINLNRKHNITFAINQAGFVIFRQKLYQLCKVYNWNKTWKNYLPWVEKSFRYFTE